MTAKNIWALGMAGMALVLAGLVVWAAWTGGGPAWGGSVERVDRGGARVEPAAWEGSPQPPQVIVELRDLRFHPSVIEVEVGTVVTFINRDSVTHNVVQTTPSRLGREEALFSSPRLAEEESWSYQFNVPGRYPILCLEGGHYGVGMLGLVVVTEPTAD